MSRVSTADGEFPRPRDDSLPADDLDRIISACDRFEHDWRAGSKPRIEAMLGAVADHLRAPLLRELIAIEVELRRRRGESPAEADYAGRFPGHRALVAGAFAAAGTPAATAAGDRIREYLLLEKLGEGGMGDVYKAVHTRLGRVVALKLLPARLRSPSAIARFEREMAATGRLDHHPHIVRAFDAGEADGRHYLALEFVDGRDLSDLARRRGPLPVPEACELVRQAAIGLEHAHEKGLVHRDVKPSNLLLGRDGIVRVADFGLALLSGGDFEGRDELTEIGQVIGTHAYMAPEQAADPRGVDIRADVYGLGATLFKLLTGRAPLDDPALGPLPPSIATIRADLPLDLARSIDRMLCRDPAGRPSTPAEVAAALGPFSGGDPRRFIPLATGDTTPPTVERRARALLDTDPEAPPRIPDAEGGKRGRPPRTSSWRSALRRPRRPVLLLGLSVVVAAIAFLAPRPVPVPEPGPGDGLRPLAEEPPPVRPPALAEPDPAPPSSTQTERDDVRAITAEILRIGGTVDIVEGERWRQLVGPAELPSGPFLVQAIIVYNPRLDDHLLARFAALQGLNTVDLKGTGITDEGVRHLGRIASLTEVDLRNTRATDRGIEAVVELSDLRRLWLSDTDITDKTLERLENQRGLWELEVKATRITDGGLASVGLLTDLRELDLRYTRITDEGLRHLRSLTKLELLGLDGTGVTAEGVAALQEALPGCKITLEE